ncbi:MAG: hypothetical protein AAF191_17765, partial [Verrucomicrobiota bacterium]
MPLRIKSLALRFHEFPLYLFLAIISVIIGAFLLRADDDPIDTDLDGLPDQWETQHFGDLLRGADEDFDLDGVTNGEEWAVEGNPTIANPLTVGETGRLEMRQGGRDQWRRIHFVGIYADPIVVASISRTGDNSDEPAQVRIRNVSSTGFDVAI